MPPLTVENTAALVGGGASGKDSEMDKNFAAVQFKVDTAFYFEGQVMEAGKTVALPRIFAIEMQSANRGKIVVPQEPAAVVEAPAPAPQPQPQKVKEKK